MPTQQENKRMTSKPLFIVIGLILTVACGRKEEISTTWIPKEPQGPTASAMPAGTPEIEWKVPKAWTAQPPSSMRVGSFSVKADNGQAVDVSVVPLVGPAGGLLSNVNRWRGQLELEPIAESDLDKNVTAITPNGRKMHLANIVSQGAVKGGHPRMRLVAAIYSAGEKTWFFKMMGEDAAVQSVLPQFKTFLESLTFHDHP